MSDRPAGDDTHFGYRTVRRAEKSGLIRGLFDGVADRYDLMNDLMSAGIHRLWKRIMVDVLAPRPDEIVLDVAGGTGDIAFRIVERAPAAKVVVVDISPNMIGHGQDRAVNRGLLEGIDWICGDAEALPIADRTIDAYAIAFGIRNVTNVDRALAEARRVLRPGGRFFCLEFSRVEASLLADVYDAYSFSVVPRLGQWVTGDRDAYQYLVESIRRFPDQGTFATMIVTAGLGQVKVRHLSGGIAALHSAWRI